MSSFSGREGCETADSALDQPDGASSDPGSDKVLKLQLYLIKGRVVLQPQITSNRGAVVLTDPFVSRVCIDAICCALW